MKRYLLNVCGDACMICVYQKTGHKIQATTTFVNAKKSFLSSFVCLAEIFMPHLFCCDGT